MSTEEIKVKKGIGIWGNTSCIQCGACCFEYNDFLYRVQKSSQSTCPNFRIVSNKAMCIAHQGKRTHPICNTYFCGNRPNHERFIEKGDERLRNIAKNLGTAPSTYKLPIL